MNFLTLKGDGYAEFTEKKSRFIGQAKRVGSESEAIEFIATVKKSQKEARHNVYAYTLRELQTTRYSDDGEPHGTAGMPVLDVIKGQGLTDTCVVVTRYFGGTLLGTGGLVRAYSRAAKEALEDGKIAEIAECDLLEIRVEYSYFERVETLILNFGGVLTEKEFADSVKLSARLQKARTEGFTEALRELTFGSARTAVKGSCFASVNP